MLCELIFLVEGLRRDSWEMEEELIVFFGIGKLMVLGVERCKKFFWG